MDVVKRLRNALGNNRPSDATSTSSGLADADADDVESLERLRDEARRAEKRLETRLLPVTRLTCWSANRRHA